MAMKVAIQALFFKGKAMTEIRSLLVSAIYKALQRFKHTGMTSLPLRKKRKSQRRHLQSHKGDQGEDAEEPGQVGKEDGQGRRH